MAKGVQIIEVPLYMYVSTKILFFIAILVSSVVVHVPTLVLKARHLSGSAFCLIDIGLPEQAVGGFPLGSGLVMEDRPSELSCMTLCMVHVYCKISPYLRVHNLCCVE